MTQDPQGNGRERLVLVPRDQWFMQGIVDAGFAVAAVGGDVRSTFTSTALANRASFNPSTAADPQRVVNFISVVAAPAGRSRSGRTAAR